MAGHQIIVAIVGNTVQGSSFNPVRAKRRIRICYAVYQSQSGRCRKHLGRDGCVEMGQILEIGSHAQVVGNLLYPYTRRLIAAMPVADLIYIRPCQYFG